MVSGTVGGSPGFGPYLVYIAVVVLVLVVLGIIVYALSRRPRRALPKHPSQHGPSNEQWPGPQPSIDLTPKEPPVQQIVIKETVKVKCSYCDALIDSTAEVCPHCGAPRT